MMPIGGVPNETGSGGRELGTRPTPSNRGRRQPPPPAEQVDWAQVVKAVQDEWDKAARQQYGGYYALIQKYPEIRDLLIRAVSEKWLPDKFQYEIQQTQWFKETTSTAREWDLTSGIDPADTQERIRRKEEEIRAKAVSIGIPLSPEALNRIAIDSLRLGYNDNDLNNALLAESERGGISNLSRGFIGQTVRETALQYGVRFSDQTLNDWANKILSGRDTTSSYENYLRNTAKALYPALANGFDRGLSFQDMTDPYANQAERILNIPAAQIDFTDPKWAKAFSLMDDKGNQRQMSFSEWNNYLRTEQSFGYEYTEDARNRAYTVVNRLAELFGAA